VHAAVEERSDNIGRSFRHETENNNAMCSGSTLVIYSRDLSLWMHLAAWVTSISMIKVRKCRSEADREREKSETDAFSACTSTTSSRCFLVSSRMLLDLARGNENRSFTPKIVTIAPRCSAKVTSVSVIPVSLVASDS